MRKKGTPILDIKPYEEHFDLNVGIRKEPNPSFMAIDNFSK
jgi:tRNA (Thr-GGU) A37 N-methylase